MKSALAGHRLDSICPGSSVAPPVGARGRPSLRGHVLLVDDDSGVVLVLSRILRRQGYEVTTATDGRKALDELAAMDPVGGGFDVVVSDMHMPVADGFTLLKAVRSQNLDLPVVLMTGHPGFESAVEAVKCGAFRYLVKPAGREALLEAVERAVQSHRLALVRRQAVAETGDERRGSGEPQEGLREVFESAVSSLWLATQAIVSWRAQSVFGHEVLARTNEQSLRNPVALFDAAEQLGETAMLGQAIRREVASILPKHPTALPIFVNVHPSDLEDPELLSGKGILSPFAPRVVLEITERAGLDRVVSVNARLKQLRSLGYRIAIDDIGAGYSGLASFAHLEPDIVKLDMSLIRGVDQSSLKQKLFSVVASLCRDLGIEMIAEGVETRPELDCAVALGGDLFQGYFFARPGVGLPAGEPSWGGASPGHPNA
jgi:EAL domain-containing protein (putative c-di-GMP-specific phosphodiesterase class I)